MIRLSVKRIHENVCVYVYAPTRPRGSQEFIFIVVLPYDRTLRSLDRWTRTAETTPSPRSVNYNLTSRQMPLAPCSICVQIVARVCRRILGTNTDDQTRIVILDVLDRRQRGGTKIENNRVSVKFRVFISYRTRSRVFSRSSRWYWRRAKRRESAIHSRTELDRSYSAAISSISIDRSYWQAARYRRFGVGARYDINNRARKKRNDSVRHMVNLNSKSPS